MNLAKSSHPTWYQGTISIPSLTLCFLCSVAGRLKANRDIAKALKAQGIAAAAAAREQDERLRDHGPVIVACDLYFLQGTGGFLQGIGDVDVDVDLVN